MKKTSLVLAVAMSLIALGCSSEKSPAPSPAPNGTVSEKSVAPPATPAAPADPAPAAAEPAAPGREIKGAGTTADGAAISLALTLGGDNQISGTFTRDATVLSVRGFMDGTVLRCWLEPTEDTASWRGILMAEGAPDKLEGTFALSDSGAAATASGTWKSL